VVAAIAAPTKSVVCFIDDSPLEIPHKNAGCPDCRSCERIFARIQQRRNLILRAIAFFNGAARVACNRRGVTFASAHTSR
jgi:hypothetical protein